jgi:hypothetical protein
MWNVRSQHAPRNANLVFRCPDMSGIGLPGFDQLVQAQIILVAAQERAFENQRRITVFELPANFSSITSGD